MRAAIRSQGTFKKSPQYPTFRNHRSGPENLCHQSDSRIISSARISVLAVFFCISLRAEFRCWYFSEDLPLWMADEEKIDGASSRGDWEDVTLTASAYAASPGPDGGLLDDSKNKEFYGEHESSSAMFFSEHFVFPPHEHENLPVENDCDEEEYIYQPGIHYIPSLEEERNYLYEFNEDSSEAGLCVPNVEYQEDQTKRSFYTETDFREMVPSDDENDADETYDSSNQNNDMSPNLVQFGKTGDCKNGGYSLPCEAWWKRHAMSLYKQAKETNKFWSICMAATLMGLVVLGQQWKKEKLQFHQLKLQFSINNERMSKMFGSVNRIKDVLVGAHHHSSVIHGSAAANL